uniref:WD repeat-containing protein 75 second beta-propeller domain-containing protein n=1 Tax=Timema poppense TaxID=170557 RepID=A0A7R9H3Z7_TIMPO|nr:unnamed protein product [Timema poppensis]
MVVVEMSEPSAIDKVGTTPIDELHIKHVTGGSIVKFSPVFSSDAKTLFLALGNIIRAFSVSTGEHVRDYKGLEARAVGVQFHPNNPHLLVALSEQGELAHWRWKTRLPPQILNLQNIWENSTPNGFYLVPKGDDQDESCDVYVTCKLKSNKYPRLCVYDEKTGESSHDNLTRNVEVNRHGVYKIAFGGQGEDKYFAGIYKKKLYISILKKKTIDIKKIGGQRSLTCVACHQEHHMIIAGDNTGRILLWQEFFENPNCGSSVYHWHTLPVTDLAFSQFGSFFYSGGGERVMVKWTLDSPDQRLYLPRLPENICHLVVAPDNLYVAISLADNGIRVVDSHLKTVSIIQHFTWCGEGEPNNKTWFPAGLNLDPRTKSMVLNGRVGHIQFFNPNTSSLLYNVDITCQNYLTQERNKVIENTDVTKISLSNDSLWLATVEQCNNLKTHFEIRLKFWNFDEVKQTFCLNTCVDMPHGENKLLDLKIQPITTEEQLLAVTTAEDNKFKVWSLEESNTINTKYIWRCESVGFFRNFPVGEISFSTDGSLLAVAFDSTLTVWVPETNQLKCNLTHTKLNSAIRHVKFGASTCCHLVVTATDTCLGVWNLLTLTLMWVVPIRINILVADSLSNLMAAFTEENDLFVFTPMSGRPVYSHRKLRPDRFSITAAIFFPRDNKQNICLSSWQQHSQLYFLDIHQELLTLEPKETIEEANQNLEALDLLPSALSTVTPFTALLAEQSTSGVQHEVTDKTHLQLGEPGREAIRQGPAPSGAPRHDLAIE